MIIGKAEVEAVEQRPLLEPGEDDGRPADVHVVGRRLIEHGDPATGREGAVNIMIAVEAQADLLELLVHWSRLAASLAA